MADHEYRTFNCGDCGHEIKVPIRCKNRFCRVCGRSRYTELRKRLDSVERTIGDDYPLRLWHITLTVKDGRDLKERYDHLVHSFRKMRQCKEWKNRIAGGLSVVEIKRGSGSGLWHPHLHILAAGDNFIPYVTIREEWMAATRDSRSVKMRRLSHVSQVSAYISKHALKSELNDLDIKAAGNLLSSARLFQTFGNWFKLLVREKSPGVPCSECGAVHCWISDIEQKITSFHYLKSQGKRV